MKSSFIKSFMAVHKFVYRYSGGLVGHGALHHRFLLLRTIGRKSGNQYITPLSYFKDGGNYILIASNWGQQNHPHWYQNLVKKPDTVIKVGIRKVPVRMRFPDSQEYVRIWMQVTRINRHYVRYQAKMDRKIPIVVLEPVLRKT